MTKEEAIKILDSVVSQVSMGRAEHVRCVEAIEALKKPDTKPEEKKE